eukprot:14435977-Ditylum_brightwellii.AAC.1
MRLTTKTTRLTLVTELLWLWWYHLQYAYLIMLLKNRPIIALLPVENMPRCQWPVLWGGGWIVNVSIIHGVPL